MKTAYAAVILDDPGILLRWWRDAVGDLLPRRKAHHMTIRFDPSADEIAALPIGESVALDVVGYADNGLIQAVVVRPRGVWSASRVPHVTVATDGFTSAKQSNDMLAYGWTPVDGPTLKGRVGIVAGGRGWFDLGVRGRTSSMHKMDINMKIIDNAGYKDLSGIRRIPIARVVGKGGVESVVVGNDAIDRAGARIRGKPYMDDATMYRLFDGSPLVVEEKVDGHPVIILHEGYTFFCEQLTIQHSVSYENVPYSFAGWPDMTVVYDVLDGEFEPPYRVGTGTKMPWLSRSEKETVCDMVGAPVVPLVWQGRVEPEGLPTLADRISSFSGASKAEGIVLKNYRTGVFGKFINLEFQQRITDEALQGGVHPMLRGVRNVRRYTAASRVADRYMRYSR